MTKPVLIGLLVIFLTAGCFAPAITPAPEPSPLALGSNDTPGTAPVLGTVGPADTGDSTAVAPAPATLGPTGSVATAAPATAALVAEATPTVGTSAASTAVIEKGVPATSASPTPGTPSAEQTILPAASRECVPGALTPSQTEGPYYSQNPPEDADLVEEGMEGTRVTVTGYVFDQACDPVPGARVDFWQADAAGEYDNRGYRLRGYQVTDAEGRYTVTTVIPGEYPGRPPHIHVKVTPPNGRTLTSQLYFPDIARNTADRLFDPALVVALQESPAGLFALYNFVVFTSR